MLLVQNLSKSTLEALTRLHQPVKPWSSTGSPIKLLENPYVSLDNERSPSDMISGGLLNDRSPNVDHKRHHLLAATICSLQESVALAKSTQSLRLLFAGKDMCEVLAQNLRLVCISVLDVFPIFLLIKETKRGSDVVIHYRFSLRSASKTQETRLFRYV